MEVPLDEINGLRNSVRRRAGHVAAAYKGKIYVWGGYMEEVKNATYNLMTQSSVCYHDPKYICQYEPLLNIWKKKECLGNIPYMLSGSYFATSGNALYIFGGFCPSNEMDFESVINILWKLDLDSFVWERLSPKGSLPYPADKGTSWCYKNRYYIFGGFGCTNGFPSNQMPYSQVKYVPDNLTRGWFDQLVYYNKDLDEWIWPKWTGKPPSPRAAHAATVVGDSVYIFGGRHEAHRLNDLHVLNLETHAWKIVNIDGSLPLGRSWHTLTTLSETQLLLYGGFSTQCQVLNDIWSFNMKTEKWFEYKWIKSNSRLWHCTVKSGPAELTSVGGIANDLLLQDDKEHAEDMLCIRLSPPPLFRLLLEYLSSRTDLVPESSWKQLTPVLRQILMKRTDPLEETTYKGLPMDCYESYKRGNRKDGVTFIQPNLDLPSQEVWCNNSFEGGGWTVILRRAPQKFQLDFRRAFSEYEDGFGNSEAEYWVGLKSLHYLTTFTQNELYVQLEIPDESAFARYNIFRVDSPIGYNLHVSGYNESSSGGNSLIYHNEMPFSTYDKDRDLDPDRSCSALAGGGGFWFNFCYYANPTGIYPPGGLPKDTALHSMVEWRRWKGFHTYLTHFTMMIRPATLNR